METDFSNITFAVEEHFLVVHATSKRTGRPYRHACPGTDFVTIATEIDAAGPDGISREDLQRVMLQRELRRRGVLRPVLWFYTPMSLPLAEGIHASAVVYDCMDELSAFKDAPAALREREPEPEGGRPGQVERSAACRPAFASRCDWRRGGACRGVSGVRRHASREASCPARPRSCRTPSATSSPTSASAPSSGSPSRMPASR